MGRPYSVDLRERVVAAIESWMSTGAAAGQFLTGKGTVYARARLKWATGRVVPPKKCKPRGSVLDPHADIILRLGEENPDVTVDREATRIAGERRVMVDRTAVWKFLDQRTPTLSAARKPRLDPDRERLPKT
jgi:transposase